MPITLIEVDLIECEIHALGECRICTNIDELVCSRGRHCTGMQIGDLPAAIGFYDDADGIGRTALTYQFAGVDDFHFCDDCAYELEHADPTDVVELVGGDVDGIAWIVDTYDGNFQAWLGSNGPDHGLAWESEGGVFDTFSEAVVASRDRAWEIVRYTDESERVAGRVQTVYPHQILVNTGLSVDMLDMVLHPAEHGDSEVTVRSVLVDACRDVVAETVANFFADSTFGPPPP